MYYWGSMKWSLNWKRCALAWWLIRTRLYLALNSGLCIFVYKGLYVCVCASVCVFAYMWHVQICVYTGIFPVWDFVQFMSKHDGSKDPNRIIRTTRCPQTSGHSWGLFSFLLPFVEDIEQVEYLMIPLVKFLLIGLLYANPQTSKQGETLRSPAG